MTKENAVSNNRELFAVGDATDELFFDDFWYVDKFAGALFSVALVVLLWLRI